MAVTPDNATLIIAASRGRRLIAFDIAGDGSLSHRRVWADLGSGVPDGIGMDADNAVWYGDVPNSCWSRGLLCVRTGRAALVFRGPSTALCSPATGSPPPASPER